MNTIDEQFDRLPPHSIEAEQCTIGSMLLCVSIGELNRITKIARREHFYQADHQIYFDLIVSMWAKGRPADAVLVREELINRQVYEEVGGFDYLAKLLDQVPSPANGEHYASVIREKYVLRANISAANDVIRQCYAPTAKDQAARISATAAREFSSLACTGQANKIHKLESAVTEVIERTEEGVVVRLPVGIVALDEMIGGLPRAKFTMVGGRPGMGKSLVIKQFLRNIAEKGVPVGIVSIEETRGKIAENCLSAYSGIENRRIAYGNMSPDEWKSVVDGGRRLSGLPFFIADEPVKLHEVDAAITTLVVEHKCQVIAIDYIQCIDADEQNENREITLISRSVKASFKRLNVAGLVAVQLNRQSVQGDGRWPTVKDLRGSGTLEQDGDLIILLHADDYYRREKGDAHRDHKLMLLVRKNKDGPQAEVPVRIDPRTQEIVDWNPSDDHPVFDSPEAA